MSENPPSGTHPQPAPTSEIVVPEGGPAAPSKNALKKAQKEKEKAEKAAKRAEEERKKKEESEANDPAKHLYGKLSGGLSDPPSHTLKSLNESLVGKEVTIEARVNNSRGQSAKLAFLDLREGNENIQAVIAETVQAEDGLLSRQMVKWCGGLNRESTVAVTALVQKPVEPVKSASISNFELHVKRCYTIASAPEMLPHQLKDAWGPPPTEQEEAEATASDHPIVGLPTRLANRTLDLRTPFNMALFSINSNIGYLFREFMMKNGFREIYTPKLLGAATEGGSNVFEVTYFERKAYLAQSPQFYKQMMIAANWERVFEVGPVFRAENSNTSRHLTEFTGLDFEMRIYKDWREVPTMAEDMVLYVLRNLPERCKEDLETIKRFSGEEVSEFKLPEGRPPRIKFSEGIQMLKEAGIDAPEDEDIRYPPSIPSHTIQLTSPSTTNEKKLGELVLQKYNSDFYTMTHYPTGARPFYTHLDPSNPKVTLSYDGFIRGQEIVSGAQRVHDADELAQRMQSLGLNPNDEGFKSYVDAFKLGCVPHGGAGFGLNRLTMLYLGLHNIRLATLFPRDPQRLFP